jgi:hypothetical protein
LSTCSKAQKSAREEGGEGEIGMNVQMSNRCKNIGMACTGMDYDEGNVWGILGANRGQVRG